MPWPRPGSLTRMAYKLEEHASGGFAYQRIAIPEHRGPGESALMLDSALDQVRAPGRGAAVEQHSADGGSPRPVMLWIRDVTSDDDAMAVARGFMPYRDLWQMRCGALPADAPTKLGARHFRTRHFREEDAEELVAMNNRAFRWHPEQGELTVEKVLALTAEPWFDADGFRLHHRRGRLAGFCWTKVHAEASPPLGEVYVVAVDPDHTGAGLGRSVTLAGLSWLAARGLEDFMLYVESDNRRAQAVYRRIGFRHHHTNRAYWHLPASRSDLRGRHPTPRRQRPLPALPASRSDRSAAA